MDHILEHEEQPLPELDTVTERSGSGTAPMNVDEDEEMEALRNLGVLKGSAEAPVEAKVRLVFSPRT